MTNQRVPVLVGISNTSFIESIKLAHFAADIGADALVLSPPYYFPLGQQEFIEYVQAMTVELPLPVYLYNIPSMTKVNIEVDTLRRVLDIEKIIGFKDSSGNMTSFHELIKLCEQRENFALLMGQEELLAEAVLFGAKGAVPGGANLFPRLFVDLYDAAKEKNIKKICELQKRLFELRKLYSCGQYASTFIKGVKCALELKGICSGYIAEPFRAFQQAEKDKIQEILSRIS